MLATGAETGVGMAEFKRDCRAGAQPDPRSYTACATLTKAGRNRRSFNTYPFCRTALPDFDGWPDHEVMRQKGLMICQWFERDYVAAVNSLHQDLGGILSLAASFVRDMDLFERQVNSFNHGLQKALKTVSGFDNFRDLQVDVRSSVSKLD